MTAKIAVQVLRAVRVPGFPWSRVEVPCWDHAVSMSLRPPPYTRLSFAMVILSLRMCCCAGVALSLVSIDLAASWDVNTKS